MSGSPPARTIRRSHLPNPRRDSQVTSSVQSHVTSSIQYKTQLFPALPLGVCGSGQPISLIQLHAGCWIMPITGFHLWPCTAAFVCSQNQSAAHHLAKVTARFDRMQASRQAFRSMQNDQAPWRTWSWSRKRRAPRSTDMSSAEDTVRRLRRGQHARWDRTGWLMWLEPKTTSVVSERSRKSCSVLYTTPTAELPECNSLCGLAFGASTTSLWRQCNLPSDVRGRVKSCRHDNWRLMMTGSCVLL